MDRPKVSMDRPEDILEETWQKWKKKRRNTVIGYLIVGVTVGMDYGFMFTTLYLYLKDLVQTAHPKLFYGIIVAVYGLSPSLWGTVSSRWVDKTRKVKLYTIVSLILEIIGSLLYVIHFHVAYPLTGRLLVGLGSAFPSVATGEVVRIYNRKESTGVLWWLALVQSIGFVAGPVMPIIFKNVNFYIWNIHLTQLNVGSLFIAALSLITLISVCFLLHDCSSEIDLKVYLQGDITEHVDEELPPCSSNKKIRLDDKEFSLSPSDRQNEHQQVDEELSPGSSDNESEQNQFEQLDEEQPLISSNQNTVVSIYVILQKFLRNTDVMLMLISTFVFMYCLFATDVLMSLLIVDVLEWNLTAMTLMFSGYGVIYFILLLVMSKYCTEEREIYKMSLICIVSLMLVFLLLIAMKIVERNETQDKMFISLVALLLSFGWVIEEMLVRSMLARMVPSHCQGFTESLRNGMSHISLVFAAITAPLIMPYLQWWAAGLCATVFILLVVFIARRSHLCIIKEMSF